MKIEKWYEKAMKIFDEEAQNGAVAANLEDGFIFSNSSGTYALFIPGYSASSVIWEKDGMKEKADRLLRIRNQVMKTAKLAEKTVTGTFCDRKCKVRQLSNGESEVYVYEKLLRMFPKNADFYITNHVSPVIVGIWDNKKFNEVGLVMPMMSGEMFKADK